MFLRSFSLTAQTKVLDLGCGDGSNIASILSGTSVIPDNIYVADIGPHVEKVAAHYGFVPVQIPESGNLGFPDNFFDIVFCSSVIEHVTVPKAEVWSLKSGKDFKARSLYRQAELAAEIRRLGRQYFVQTPNKWFPVESHTWLPVVGWLPRRILLPVLRVSNMFWVKKTKPDWNLLTRDEMAALFPNAYIQVERSLGMVKSVIAIKTDKADDVGAN